LKESDFQNFRLENGIKLWQGMWEYRAPNVQCFIAPVKPRARQFLQSTSTTTPQSGEVFVGKVYIEQHHDLLIKLNFQKRRDMKMKCH
jgi:protein unc-80